MDVQKGQSVTVKMATISGRKHNFGYVKSENETRCGRVVTVCDENVMSGTRVLTCDADGFQINTNKG